MNGYHFIKEIRNDKSQGNSILLELK